MGIPVQRFEDLHHGFANDTYPLPAFYPSRWFTRLVING